MNFITQNRQDENDKQQQIKKNHKSGDGPESIKRQTTPTKGVVEVGGASVAVRQVSAGYGGVAKDEAVHVAKEETGVKVKSLDKNQKSLYEVDNKALETRANEDKIGIARLTKNTSTKKRNLTRENVSSESCTNNTQDNKAYCEGHVLQKQDMHDEVKVAPGHDRNVVHDKIQESQQLPPVVSKPIIIDGEKVQKGKMNQSSLYIIIIMNISVNVY